MRYSLEQYDKHGFLKAPILLWLGWLFLAKALVVFVVAGASRESGAKILEIVYPDHQMFYVGIALSVPSVLLMWLFGLRSPERPYINTIVSWGRWVTFFAVLSQFAHTVYLVYLDHGVFHWLHGVTLMLLLWFLIYLIKSNTVRDCFIAVEAED
ncbi:DUF2919 domain-containing protein [Vibrio fortis]|uniref:DUF2919 domain-containing protein n=1 Tax=Vibrio TaxID=662 RepID=UPI001EFDEC4C|nr:DUF2919 domain-containing protein [Vibrio fortis]MCG9631183.1 DUF2919 domain-containing protein [Vibrio sp. Isolate30]